MGYKVECRLPSLNSLALDFALPQHAAQDHYYASYPAHYPHYDSAPPPMDSRTLPGMVPSTVVHLKPDIFTAKAVPVGYAAHDPFGPASFNPSRIGTPSLPSTAYVTNPYPASYSSKSSLSEPATDESAATVLPAVPAISAFHIPPVNQKAPSPPLVRSDLSARSDPPARSDLVEERVSSEEPSDVDDPASPKTSESAEPESPEPSKKRKKRQCPQCLQHFSNLATHRSTHLNPTARPNVCKVCKRGFARPNDLFRHFKCHWKEMGADHGQFKCPFKTGQSGDKCSHSSGIFSRCDTYKNHLKAIHFQYPEGTKKSNRSKIPGTCKLCNKEFKTVDAWISSHIETHDCSGIE